MSPLHHHFELGGWDEEKITLRFWIVGDPRRAARRDPLPRLAEPAASDDDDDRPTRSISTRLTLDGVRAGALRDRPVTVLGLARSGIALARFLADAGARVTVYDGRPAGGARRRDRRRSSGRAVRLRAGPGRRPGDGLGRRGARHDLAVDQPRLPDDRAAPARGAARRSSTRGPRGDRDRPGRSSPRRTCSCASARRRRSA